MVFTLPSLAETVAPANDTAGAAATTATPDELLQQWYQLGAQLRANGNYPFTELRKGDTGFEVIELQKRLAELGYYQKEIVDNFGSGTYNALRAFEKANGLKTNGIASVADQQLLFGSNAVLYTAAVSTSGGSGKSSGGNGNSSGGSDATSSATK